MMIIQLLATACILCAVRTFAKPVDHLNVILPRPDDAHTKIIAVKAHPHQNLPDYAKHNLHHEEEPVAYAFSYDVHDEHTKDIKSQKEIREGDTVKGRYELIDSDGYKRIVEYTADEHNGFQAIVHREKTDIVVPIPEHKPYDHHYPSYKNEIYSKPEKSVHHLINIQPDTGYYNHPNEHKSNYVKPKIILTAASPSSPAPLLPPLSPTTFKPIQQHSLPIVSSKHTVVPVHSKAGLKYTIPEYKITANKNSHLDYIH